MWKPLHANQSVHPGDQIRCASNTSFINSKTLFKVTKADQFYFELAPALVPPDTPQNKLTKRVVKYFDIGHYIDLEVWIEE